MDDRDAVTRIAKPQSGQADAAEAAPTVFAPVAAPPLDGDAETVVIKSVADPASEATRIQPVAREAGRAIDAQLSDSAATVTAAGVVIKGRFELQKNIGAGGMGVVYSAIDRIKADAGDPKHWLAIKLLKADFASDPGLFVALQREASKAQALAHPNIATVFDFDRDGETAFITMELLVGQSLEKLLKEASGKGLSPPIAKKIITGVAEGLAYAHRKHVVHSDLKPANVFLLEDGTAKLLDFGIARSLPGQSGHAQQVDAFDAGSLKAYTAAYATEEMIASAKAETREELAALPDPAACDDVYALGIVAYELLTGRHPYGRVIAPEARKRGLVPAPIRNISRREWKTIASALAFAREDRPADAGVFLKQFNGTHVLRYTIAAALLVIAVLVGGFEYRSYLATGPAVPFSELPADTQKQISDALDYGDKSWAFFAKEGIADGAMTSVDAYATAYELHPRDRNAVRGLKRSADAILKMTEHDAALHREAAGTLAAKSEFLARYPPVASLLESGPR